MLVLSRLVNQEVVIIVPPSAIEQRITVRLCAIPSLHRARLGITANDDVEILRDEIWREIQDETNSDTSDG